VRVLAISLTYTVKTKEMSGARQAAAHVEGTSTTIEPLIGKKEIATTLGVSVRLLERLISGGRFPAPDVVFCRLPRWRSQTVRGWIEQGGPTS
jgi:predicted DNA-binding transcriptional regulator AlpA